MEDKRFRLPSLRSLMDFALVLGGTAFATGTGFVLKVFIGRTLGADSLGIFAMCYAVLIVVSIGADLGIRYSMVNLGARNLKENPKRVRSYVAAGLVVKLIGGVVALGLLWLASDTIANHLFRKPEVAPFLKITGVGVFLWSLWDGVEGALHIKQRFSTAAGLRIIMEVARLCAFFGLYYYQDGVKLAMGAFMWLYFLAISLSVGVGLLVVAAVMQPTLINVEEQARELLSFSRGVFFYRSCTMVLVLMDSLALTRYGTLEQVGQFEAAKGLAYALLLVSESLGMVLLPKVNQIEALDEVKNMLRRFAVYLGGLTVVAGIWLTFAGRFLVLFGPDFTQPQVVWTFQILVVATLFTIPATILGMVLLSLGQPGALGKIACFQVIMGILIYPVTCVQAGIIGAALTGVFLQLTGAVMMALVLRKEISGKTSHPAFGD